LLNIVRQLELFFEELDASVGVLHKNELKKNIFFFLYI